MFEGLLLIIAIIVVFTHLWIGVFTVRSWMLHRENLKPRWFVEQWFYDRTRWPKE